MFHILLLSMHWYRWCSIVSIDSQKLHFVDCLIDHLYNFSFVLRILLIILYWKLWRYGSLTYLNGMLYISFQSYFSKKGCISIHQSIAVGAFILLMLKVLYNILFLIIDIDLFIFPIFIFGSVDCMYMSLQFCKNNIFHSFGMLLLSALYSSCVRLVCFLLLNSWIFRNSFCGAIYILTIRMLHLLIRISRGLLIVPSKS